MNRGLLTALLGFAAACAPPPSKTSVDAPSTDHADDGWRGADEHPTNGDRGARDTSRDESPVPASATETAAAFDLDAWAREHGAVVELSVDGCELARLGSKPDETLWCYRHEEQNGARVLYFRTLYALVGRRLLRVTELPTAAGPFASEGERVAPRTVELTAKAGADGQSVTLEEVAGRTCDDARAANDKALVDEPLGGPEFLKLVDRVCGARGRYSWHPGALTKER
jgi:hypothetical protein